MFRVEEVEDQQRSWGDGVPGLTQRGGSVGSIPMGGPFDSAKETLGEGGHIAWGTFCICF